MLDQLRELQSEYIQLIENEDVRHVEVLQEYLDLVSGFRSLPSYPNQVLVEDFRDVPPS